MGKAGGEPTAAPAQINGFVPPLFYLLWQNTLQNTPPVGHGTGPRPPHFLGCICVSKAKMYNLSPEDIYLVHDDLDKALGKVAIKLGGSARGHNGVRSCISALRSDEMTRLRVGIGRPEGGTTVTCYVLGPFSSREQEMLQQVLAQAATCLLEHILQRRAPRGEPGDRG
nr:PREDICTED: probable peptidyl-tRNA hydrolase [Apteryx mantelli mantelli]